MVNNMKKNGFTLIELITVIALLTIIITLSFTTYRNVDIRIRNQQYNNKISLIEIKAAEYASNTKVLITNVDYLVKNGYLTADNEAGDILNPIDGERMNCYIINMYSSDGFYYGEYVQDKNYQECNSNKLDKLNKNMIIKKENLTNGHWEESTSLWTNQDIRLNVDIQKEEIKDQVDAGKMSSIKWKAYYDVNENTTTSMTYTIHAEDNYIIDGPFNATLVMESGLTYQGSTQVKIDKAQPLITEIEIENNDLWTNTSKKVKISTTDEGAGVSEYAILSESRTCNDDVFTEENKLKNRVVTTNQNTYTYQIENIGTYYVCVRDAAGNISESDDPKNIFEVKNIDNTPPTCSINLESSTPKNSNEWYKTDVKITFNDGNETEQFQSGIQNKTILLNGVKYEENEFNLDYDTKNFKVTLNVTDASGNVCTKAEIINLDKTKPECRYDGESNSWTSENHSISLYCQDNLSGCTNENSIISKNYTETINMDDHFGTYEIKDKAGNTNICDRSVSVKVDKCDFSSPVYGRWTDCSTSCGIGTKTRRIDYVSDTGSNFTCPTNGRLQTESTNCKIKDCDLGESSTDTCPCLHTHNDEWGSWPDCDCLCDAIE